MELETEKAMDAVVADLPEYQKEIDDAIQYVVGKHLGQYRKEPKFCPLPYIIHPFGVLQQVAQWGITNIVTWKSSLGHDLREDCGVSFEEVGKALGIASANVIEELTFIPDPLSGMTEQQQKQEYMQSFFDKSVRALVIKVADRCCNTLDWMDSSFDYAPKYWKKAEDLFSAMLSRKEDIVRFYGGPEVKSNMRGKPGYKEAKAQRELGEVVFTRMCYTRTEIGHMLVR